MHLKPFTYVALRDSATVGDIIGNPELAPQFVHTVEGQVIYIPFEGLKWSTNVSYNYLQDQASFGLQGFNLVARNVAELSTLTLSILETHFRNVAGGFLKCEKVWSERNPGLVGYQADLIGTGNAVYPEQVIRAGVWVEVAKAFSRASVMGSYVGERRSSDTNILEKWQFRPVFTGSVSRAGCNTFHAAFFIWGRRRHLGEGNG